VITLRSRGRVHTAVFLSHLYAGAGSTSCGYLSIWDLQTSQTAYFDTGGRDDTFFTAVHDYVHERIERQCDVYFGVGLRRRPLSENQRGGKAEVLSLPALWLDVDIAGPGHKAKKQNLPASVDEAISIVEGVCPQSPSIIVHSGGGLHCYWLLDEPLEIGKSVASYNAVSKSFQKQFIVAAAARGLHVDQTGNIDRVLRLPNTFNFKTLPARSVEVIFHEDVRYSLKSLATQATRALAAVPSPGARGTDFLAVVRARLPKLANAENRELMSLVLRGQPFADPGERDSTLQRAASCVAFVLSPKEASVADAEALAALFEPSITAMAAESDDPDNPAPTTEIVVDKIGRALDDRARSVVEDEAILKHFGVGTSPSTPEAPSEAPSNPAAEAQPPVLRFEDESDETLVNQYTDEDIIAFAAKHKCDPPESFIKRWIIQHDSSYYVFVDGKYKTPVPRESLLTHLREDLKRAEKLGVRLYTYTKAGSVRSKTVPEVLNEYATGARNLKGSLYMEESHFDEPNETFWEAVCPVRPIEPVYDEKIDKWLHLLGGPEAGKLLDWVATVVRLDLQSCALYLSGVADAGKTMLANGLARLWSTSGPTHLEDVAGTAFNGDITRCPLIFGDEEVKCSTSELRRLVGSSSHKLKRKYLANVDVEGALRIILADNNGKLIHGHDHSGADIGAVASKFLHIIVGQDPVNYLRSIGGRNDGTSDWVDGDRIAAHALWIALNRKVQLGSRFAVEGTHLRMAQLLVTRDRTIGVVCEWIARYLESPAASIGQTHGAVVGNGKILVAAETIAKFWTTYVQSERQPFSIGKIGRALVDISDGRIKVGQRRYHSIKPELVYTWADEHLSCDVDELRRKVNAGGGGSDPDPTADGGGVPPVAASGGGSAAALGTN
jgi:hypothetical protein